jgi:hypothetical protein
MQLQSGDRAFRSGSWAGEQPVADPDPWTGSISVDDNAAVRINGLDRLREQGHGIGLNESLVGHDCGYGRSEQPQSACAVQPVHAVDDPWFAVGVPRS